MEYFDNEEELREYLKNAIDNGVKKKKNTKKIRLEVEKIESLLTEFLDSFILIGYNFEGQSITINSANTSQRKDALNTLLVKYLSYGNYDVE